MKIRHNFTHGEQASYVFRIGLAPLLRERGQLAGRGCFWCCGTEGKHLPGSFTGARTAARPIHWEQTCIAQVTLECLDGDGVEIKLHIVAVAATAHMLGIRISFERTRKIAAIGENSTTFYEGSATFSEG